MFEYCVYLFIYFVEFERKNKIKCWYCRATAEDPWWWGKAAGCTWSASSPSASDAPVRGYRASTPKCPRTSTGSTGTCTDHRGYNLVAVFFLLDHHMANEEGETVKAVLYRGTEFGLSKLATCSTWCYEDAEKTKHKTKCDTFAEKMCYRLNSFCNNSLYPSAGNTISHNY